MSKRVAAVIVVLITVAAACSSTKNSASTPPSTTTAATTTTTASSKCTPAATPPVHAVAVPGVASDHVITSFDGAQIHVHWFPLADPPAGGAPTVLMGPGWGSGGATDTTDAGTQGNISIKDLRDAGYNVLTWDPRGFGQSTGTIEIDSAAFEARDVGRILDWVATQPGVQLDGPRDPRVGMVGASYGGGIQITTAATDCRVDAIVPSWAWNSLTTSLDKATTPKTGWSTFLYGVASGRQLDPHIRAAQTSELATGRLSAADATWFAQRGPGNLVAHITAPTLFVQGTVDTLFTLDEAVQNYDILRAHHVPTSMIWFCGGHGVCLTNNGNVPVAERTLSWLAHYLKRDPSVATGTGFLFVDQRGTTYSSREFPPAMGTPITGSGGGTLQLVAGGGAGPASVSGGTHGGLGALVTPITPAKATTALNVSVPTGTPAAVIAGAPQLELTYHGTVAAGPRPERVFAQLVDPATGLVLGNQITPIDVTLDGKSHTTTVPLEMVAFTTKPGGSLLLQIVATTVAYAQPRLGGSISMTAKLELPATTLTAR
jgi:ABC-2 type transport system ATP-binding protein